MIIVGIMATVIATGIGGIIGTIFGRKKNIGKILAFASGIMISVVAFEIIPEALNSTNILLVIVFILVGLVLVEIVEMIFNYYDNQKMRSIKRTGLILLVVIGLHNFPEGLAIGASGATDVTLGLILSFIVAIHDISEGMAIAVPLLAAGYSKKKVIIYSFISGTTTIIGAMLGLLFGGLSKLSQSITLAIAGGAMLYVVYLEMIPESLEYEKPKWVANCVILGIIIGILIIYFS
ncbi:MAG TPA: ZIP family metal transporter [Acholeplasmataceae bacterium]|nr:ZIP family metal transporter [Acholeplasmataceae bacterium]